jgi:hypothetical protein
MMGVIIRQQFIDINGVLQDAKSIGQVSTFMVDGAIVGQVPEYESTLEIGEYRVQNTPKVRAAVDRVTVTGGIDIISTRDGMPRKEVVGLDASDFIIKVMEPGIITVVSREIEDITQDKETKQTERKKQTEQREEQKKAEQTTRRQTKTRETTRREDERKEEDRGSETRRRGERR